MRKILIAEETRKMEPLLSVIIPVYNLENYLSECIASIINQTYKNLEIIIVNDGSTDNSLEVINKFKSIDSRIVVIDQLNKGVSAARTAGINIASGEVITFVDADDVIDEETYERNVSHFFKKQSPDCVQFPILYRWEGKNSVKHSLSKEFSSKEELVDGFLKGEITFSTCDKIFKRHLFQTVRFPLNVRYEDMFFCYMLLDSVNRLYISSDGCYFYRTHNSSFSNEITDGEKIKNYLKISEMFSEASLQYLSLNASRARFSLFLMCNIASGYLGMNSFDKKAILKNYKSLYCSPGMYLSAIGKKILSKKLLLFGLLKQLVGTHTALIIFGKFFELYYKSSNK